MWSDDEFLLKCKLMLTVSEISLWNKLGFFPNFSSFQLVTTLHKLKLKPFAIAERWKLQDISTTLVLFVHLFGWCAFMGFGAEQVFHFRQRVSTVTFLPLLLTVSWNESIFLWKSICWLILFPANGVIYMEWVSVFRNYSGYSLVLLGLGSLLCCC